MAAHHFRYELEKLSNYVHGTGEQPPELVLGFLDSLREKVESLQKQVEAKPESSNRGKFAEIYRTLDELEGHIRNGLSGSAKTEARANLDFIREEIRGIASEHGELKP